jgi:hypothetical protein
MHQPALRVVSALQQIGDLDLGAYGHERLAHFTVPKPL